MHPSDSFSLSSATPWAPASPRKPCRLPTRLCHSLWLKGIGLAVSQGPWTKKTLREFPPNRSNPKVPEGWVLTLAHKN